MADNADIAQRQHEQLEELKRRERAARDQYADDTVIHITCISCGNTIPPERRKAAPGCQRCITCQDRRERKEREFM